MRFRQEKEFTDMEGGGQQEFAKWSTHSAKMRSRMKTPADYRPWSSKAKLHGIPANARRAREEIELGYIHTDREAQRKARLKRNPVPYRPESIPKSLWCDFSQAVQRRPFGPLGTLTTSSWLYSYEQDVVIPGAAHLALHGYPKAVDLSAFGDAAEKRNSLARALMGESFALPSGAVALVCALLVQGAPWWHGASPFDGKRR